MRSDIRRNVCSCLDLRHTKVSAKLPGMRMAVRVRSGMWVATRVQYLC